MERVVEGVLICVSRTKNRVTTDWTAGIQSPTEAEDFSSNLCVQTGSGVHPASRTVGTGGSFPGGKARPGRDADHSPRSSAEVKKQQGLYLLSPKAPLWRVAGHILSFSVATGATSEVTNVENWTKHTTAVWSV
jgi:hypothetical protein